MKKKRNIIIASTTVLIVVVAVTVMALIGSNGAGSSVAAARGYIEASMKYDADKMASLASENQRKELYRSGEIPTVRQLAKMLKKSYEETETPYKDKSITFTVLEKRENGNTGYVKLKVYVDGKENNIIECATVKVNDRWYYNGAPEEEK